MGKVLEIKVWEKNRNIYQNRIKRDVVRQNLVAMMCELPDFHPVALKLAELVEARDKTEGKR